MPEEYEIIDKNHDKDHSRGKEELQSFLIAWKDGRTPELKNATPENVLLYIHGMYEFLNGDKGVVLSHDPKVMIAPTGNEYCYILNVNGHAVETTPSQSQQVLEGVKQAVEDGKINHIQSVHHDIVSNQVRKSLVNALRKTFDADEQQRITVASNGWLVDGFYLVNWEASMYTSENEEGESYQLGGGGVVEADRSHEFVNLNAPRDVDTKKVRVNGTEYELTEREMLFLGKVKWLLHREHFHPDKPFWEFSDKYGGVTDVEEMDDDERDDSFIPKF